MTVDTPDNIIRPEDFRRIEDVFKALIREQGLVLGSEDADILAARLIGLYQSGVRDKKTLRTMVTDR